MRVRVEVKKRVMLATLMGELDHHAATQLRARLDRELTKHKIKTLIVDLSQVGFMDSSGVGLLIGRYRQMKLSGGQMCIVSSEKTVDKMLTVSGIRKLVKVYRDPKNALEEGLANE